VILFFTKNLLYANIVAKNDCVENDKNISKDVVAWSWAF